MSTPTDAARRTPARAPWLAAFIVVWLVAPLLLVAALSWVSWQQSTDGPAQAVWAVAEDAGDVTERRVELVITRSDPVTVVAPAWSGTVRRVSVAVGQSLASGDVVAEIDGITRLAWHTPAPFYRPLAQRDTGDDVAALNSILRTRGLTAGPGNNFTWQTRQGVIQLGRELGIANNRGVFDPGLIVYLPRPGLTVTEVQLRVGQPAPGLGSAVVTTAPEVTSVLLAPPGMSMSSTDDTSATETSPGLVAAPDETLLLGETELSLAESRDRLDASGIAHVAGVVSDERDVVIAQLRRALPDGSVRIPSAAVHTAPDGTMCVVVGTPDSSSIMPVSVLGGLAGETLVTGGVNPGDQVGIGVHTPGAPCA